MSSVEGHALAWSVICFCEILFVRLFVFLDSFVIRQHFIFFPSSWRWKLLNRARFLDRRQKDESDVKAI